MEFNLEFKVLISVLNGIWFRLNFLKFQSGVYHLLAMLDKQYQVRMKLSASDSLLRYFQTLF